jgi:quercetin dioxygenase-like cupin family protein
MGKQPERWFEQKGAKCDMILKGNNRKNSEKTLVLMKAHSTSHTHTHTHTHEMID